MPKNPDYHTASNKEYFLIVTQILKLVQTFCIAPSSSFHRKLVSVNWSRNRAQLLSRMWSYSYVVTRLLERQHWRNRYPRYYILTFFMYKSEMIITLFLTRKWITVQKSWTFLIVGSLILRCTVTLLLSSVVIYRSSNRYTAA